MTSEVMNLQWGAEVSTGSRKTLQLVDMDTLCFEL